jgi:hypothetical protein
MSSRHSISAFVLALTLAVVVPGASTGPAFATPKRSASLVSLVSAGTNQTSTTDDFVSDLDNGTGLPPSRGTSAVEQLKKEQDSRVASLRSFAATPSTAAAKPLAAYHVSGIVQRALPVGQRPYENAPLVRGITDSTGVRMFRLAGDATVYNHPVGQAQLSMAYLDQYRLTGRADYLRLAKANAQRLIDRRVESRGGWYFAYDFDFAVHGDTSQTLRAPWYSGMAQGMALSAFTRLYQATNDPAWKAAADATYASLDNGPVEGEPFGSWVSSTGDLWLEEYPRWPVETSERVLNGHIFAAFGVYDYAQLTGSADAMRLYDGALTTVTRYLMSEYRTPRWASKYSLRHRLPTTSYHQTHVMQMLYLQHQTGNPIYTRWANVLRSDFPMRTSKGFGVITPSTTVIYQLNAARQVVRTRAVKFARGTGAPVDRRERAFGGPIMLRVSAGAYSGWWFPEAYTKARIRGAVDVHSYDPALRATFASRTSVIAYKYDSLNRLVSYKRLTFTRQSEAPVSKSAIVDGRLAYYLPIGAFAGHWVGATSGLTVR